MLESGFTSVLAVRSRSELQDQVVAFTKRLGFETVSATVVIDHLLGEACKRQSMPIIWGQSTYAEQGLGEMWEHQARFGYRNGIAMALHMPEGRHFFFGVDRDKPVPPDTGELTRIVADLQLFAVHAQDAAMRILTPSLVSGDRPSLTPRELEALRWTMDGKTAWEVAHVLGISERTAVLHINNAMHKLDCVNKHQAVLKALRLGLIK